jgi:hypothetical protein
MYSSPSLLRPLASPCHATHASCFVNRIRVRNSFLWKTNFCLVYQLSWVCVGHAWGMFAVCPRLSCVAVRSEPRLPCYTRRHNAWFLSVSLTTKFPLLRRPLDFPVLTTACTAIRKSRHLKPRPSRSYTGRRAIRFLGSVFATACVRSSSSSPICILLFRFGDFDLHHG